MLMMLLLLLLARVVVMMMVVVMVMTCRYVLFAISQQQEIKQSQDVDGHGDDDDGHGDDGHGDDDDGHGDDAVEQVCVVCHQLAAGDQAES